MKLLFFQAVKKVKLDFRHNRGYGHVLTVGQGDTGQLGLGEDIMEKSRPGLITTLSDAVDIVAGNTIFQRECSSSKSLAFFLCQSSV